MFLSVYARIDLPQVQTTANTRDGSRRSSGEIVSGGDSGIGLFPDASIAPDAQAAAADA